MDELVRRPGQSHACPRCGRPVTYKGRGRRPVWCSSTCRVEAAIERKGNRLVGVQPQLLRIEGTRDAKERQIRERVEREMPDRVAVARVAASPALLEQLVGEVRRSVRSHGDERRDSVARQLVRAAEQLKPGITSSEGRTHKRPAQEWAVLLAELIALLRTGQFYDRDLPKIDEPIKELWSVYLRRRGQLR